MPARRSNSPGHSKAAQAPPLSTRLTPEERLAFEAVAYEWSVSEDLASSADELNLSMFLRRIIRDVTRSMGAEMDGGLNEVIRRYERARTAAGLPTTTSETANGY